MRHFGEVSTPHARFELRSSPQPPHLRASPLRAQPSVAVNFAAVHASPLAATVATTSRAARSCVVMLPPPLPATEVLAPLHMLTAREAERRHFYEAERVRVTAAASLPRLLTTRSLVDEKTTRLCEIAAVARAVASDAASRTPPSDRRSAALIAKLRAGAVRLKTLVVTAQRAQEPAAGKLRMIVFLQPV